MQTRIHNRFSSEYFDTETGLVYYNYRYFSPDLGRWASRDPIGEEGGNNLYVITLNNPISYIDYIGQEEVTLETTPRDGHGNIDQPQGLFNSTIYIG